MNLQDLKVGDEIAIGGAAFKITGLQNNKVLGKQIAEFGRIVVSDTNFFLDLRLSGWELIKVDVNIRDGGPRYTP